MGPRVPYIRDTVFCIIDTEDCIYDTERSIGGETRLRQIPQSMMAVRARQGSSFSWSPDPLIWPLIKLVSVLEALMICSKTGRGIQVMSINTAPRTCQYEVEGAGLINIQTYPTSIFIHKFKNILHLFVSIN